MEAKENSEINCWGMKVNQKEGVINQKREGVKKEGETTPSRLGPSFFLSRID